MEKLYENAFKVLNLLEEEDFELDAIEDNELKDFLDDKEEETVDIIDPMAEDEEDVKDSYMGKVVLECSVCHSLIYKDPSEVIEDNDSEDGLVNVGDECPYCMSTDGYKIVGQIAPFTETEVEVEVEPKDDEEVEVEDETEEVTESLIRKRARKNLTEAFDGRHAEKEVKSLYDFLLDFEIATEDELNLVTSIWGMNLDTLEKVLYSRTGYRSLDQAQDIYNESLNFKTMPIPKKGATFAFRATVDEPEISRLLQKKNLKFDKVNDNGTIVWLIGHGDTDHIATYVPSTKTLYTDTRELFRESYMINDSLNEDTTYKDLYFGGIYFKLKDAEDKEMAKQLIYSTFDVMNSEGGFMNIEGGFFKIKKTKSGYLLKYYGNIGSIYYDKYFKDFIRKMKSAGIEITYEPKYSELELIFDRKDHIDSLEDEQKVQAFLNSKNESLNEAAGNQYGRAIPYQVSDDLWRVRLSNKYRDLTEYDIWGYGSTTKPKNFNSEIAAEDAAAKYNQRYEDIEDELDESLNEAFDINSMSRIKLIDAIDKFYREDEMLFSDNYIIDYKTMEDILDENGASEDDSDPDEGFYHSMSNEQLKNVFQIIRNYLKTRDADEYDDYSSDIYSTFKLKRGWVDESLENLDIETEHDKIHIEAEEKTDDDEEMIVPIDPEVEDEIEDNSELVDSEEEPNQEDVDIEEFDEESFDELGESFLKKHYSNVSSFKTTKIFDSGNNLFVEGLITFNSGSKKNTSFKFTPSTIRNNKVKFFGENLQINNGKKAFKLNGRLNGNKLIAESLTYNYIAKNQKNESKRVSGTVSLKEAKVGKDLSKKEGSMSNIIEKNLNKINASASKDELLNNLTNIFKDNGLDTEASKRLLLNVKKSKSLTAALSTVYNSYLAGSNLAVDRK